MRVWLGIVVLAACAAAWADGPQEVDSTVITSESVTFDYKRSVAVFMKRVHVVDPQVQLTADRLNVIFRKGEEQAVKSLTAIGNVRIWNDLWTATAERAVYLAGTGEMVLTGSPRMVRGQESLAGRVIVLWVEDQRVECDRGELVIHPGEGRSANLLNLGVPRDGQAGSGTPSGGGGRETP